MSAPSRGTQARLPGANQVANDTGDPALELWTAHTKRKQNFGFFPFDLLIINEDPSGSRAKVPSNCSLILRPKYIKSAISSRLRLISSRALALSCLPWSLGAVSCDTWSNKTRALKSCLIRLAANEMMDMRRLIGFSPRLMSRDHDLHLNPDLGRDSSSHCLGSNYNCDAKSIHRARISFRRRVIKVKDDGKELMRCDQQFKCSPMRRLRDLSLTVRTSALGVRLVSSRLLFWRFRQESHRWRTIPSWSRWACEKIEFRFVVAESSWRSADAADQTEGCATYSDCVIARLVDCTIQPSRFASEMNRNRLSSLIQDACGSGLMMKSKEMKASQLLPGLSTGTPSFRHFTGWARLMTSSWWATFWPAGRICMRSQPAMRSPSITFLSLAIIIEKSESQRASRLTKNFSFEIEIADSDENGILDRRRTLMLVHMGSREEASGYFEVVWKSRVRMLAHAFVWIGKERWEGWDKVSQVDKQLRGVRTLELGKQPMRCDCFIFVYGIFNYCKINYHWWAIPQGQLCTWRFPEPQIIIRGFPLTPSTSALSPFKILSRRTRVHHFLLRPLPATHEHMIQKAA